jgi:NitT/TauT family transport system substrate-binding protein
VNRRSLLVAGTAAFALAPALRARGRAADVTPLRLAAPPTDASAQYYYADAEGFFKKAGFSDDIAHLANGEAVTAGVIGGSIDIGVSQTISLIAAYSRGVPLTIVTGSAINNSRSNPGTAGAFFVPMTSTVASGKDLTGKTVGVQGLHGFAQYGTQNWIDKTGGDSSQVKFVELSSPVMAKALTDNRLDGAFIPEPFVADVAKVARKIATPMDAIAPFFYQGAHFTTLAYARANPDILHRFEAVMYETSDWANKNKDKTAEILADAAHIDLASVRGAVRCEFAVKRDPTLLQPMIALAVKYGGIKPFAAEDLFFKN